MKKRILNVNEKGELVADSNLLSKIYDYEVKKAEIEPLEKQLKEELLEYCVNSNISKLDVSDKISCTLKKGSTRKTFDTKKFKEENPITYENYLKETSVKDSVSLIFE